MLPYGGLVTRLMLAYNICISPDEEIIQVDQFNTINRNILKRLRCTFSNGIWIRQPRRTDPVPPLVEHLETPIFSGNESPPSSPFSAAPLEPTPASSSVDPIMAELNQIKTQQEQLKSQQEQIQS